MAQFRVEVPIAAPVELVWQRLTDWPAHAQLAPLTTIRVIGPGDQPGSVFVARTGVGRLAFDDAMEIEEFVAPVSRSTGEHPRGATVSGGVAESGVVGGPGVVGHPGADGGPGDLDGAGDLDGLADRSLPTASEGPAARFRVRKTSWAVRGWIVAELWAEPGEAGRPGSPTTRLVWTEEVRVPPEPLTRLFSPLIAAVAKAGYGAALRKLGRQVEEQARG